MTLFKKNKLFDFHYVEPFAGGCGLALELLMAQAVTYIHINDIDRGVWSFWHSILTRSSDFITKMHQTELTIKEWRKQRYIRNHPDEFNVLELGFATFFS